MIKLGQIGIGCIQEGPSMKIHSRRAYSLERSRAELFDSMKRNIVRICTLSRFSGSNRARRRRLPFGCRQRLWNPSYKRYLMTEIPNEFDR